MSHDIELPYSLILHNITMSFLSLLKRKLVRLEMKLMQCLIIIIIIIIIIIMITVLGTCIVS